MDECGPRWSIFAGSAAIADSHGPNGLEEELEDACELLHGPKLVGGTFADHGPRSCIP